MRLGIIGLPGSGKTTLFRAISGVPAASADVSGLPGTRAAAVLVPDERFQNLCRMFEPKKRVPASFEAVDVTGLVLGGGRRIELDPEVLGRVRQLDAFVVVLRGFADPGIPAAGGSVDPRRDLETILGELIINDLDTAERWAERLRKSSARPTPRREQELAELALVERIAAKLAEEVPLSAMEFGGEEQKRLKSFAFLTAKPYLVVLNVDQPAPAEDERARALCAGRAAGLAVAARLELEVAELDEADRAPFLADLGLAALAAPRLIRAGFATLGLINFFTVGADEVRAWILPRGGTALEAAGCIHSDLARGFIRAETTAYADLAAAGGLKQARAAGKTRHEPRDYRVQDGDVLEIKFSV